MKTSAAGLKAIEQREGVRLEAYRDSTGVPTIGVGHTGRMSPPPVVDGMTITQAQCDAFLAADLAPVEAAINSVVKVPITQNQFDAMASLAFNIGVGGFKSSEVVKSLNAKEYAAAANAFLNWEKPAVLAGRREAERKQFLTPDLLPHAGEGVSASCTAPSPTPPPQGGGLSSPLKPVAPAAAAPASSPAAKKEPSMFGTLLSSVLTGLHFQTSGLGTLIGIAENAPTAINTAEEIAGDAAQFLPVAKTLWSDLTAIVKAGEGGKWTEEPADLAKLGSDIQAAWSKSKLTASSVAAAVQKLAPAAKAA